MKTIILSDVHGWAGTLRAATAEAAPGPEDQLVMLGDLFDRGPESWEVFREVKKLAAEMGDRFVLLRGNHEDYLLRTKLSRGEMQIWNQVGREAAVKSFRAHGENMEDAAPWLRKHCETWWEEEDFLCVHAGLMVDPPEVNDEWTLIHDHEAATRNCYRGPFAVAGHAGLEKATWFAGDGETEREMPEGTWMPLPEIGILCIDTGCGKGGRLTAMEIENGQFRLTSYPEKRIGDAWKNESDENRQEDEEHGT